MSAVVEPMEGGGLMRVQAKDVKMGDVIDGRRVTWILGGDGVSVMRCAFDGEQRVGMARVVDEWVEVERPEKLVTVVIELTVAEADKMERDWGPWSVSAFQGATNNVLAKVGAAVKDARA